MNEQTEKLIRELAAQLGTTAEHLWGVLIRQSYIGAFSDIFISLFWIILVVITLFISFRKFPKKYTEDWEDYPHVWIPVIISTITVVVFSVVMLICLMSGLGDLPTRLLNPEYWALKQIIK